MHNAFFKQLESLNEGDTVSLDAVIDTLRFNDDGLIPAIAQQHDTGEVLMMAWMNLESLRESLATGQVCYWSRSRQTLWRKGESSGHRQSLVQLRVDCDGDTILCLVDQKGPACHTNRRNCFYLQVESDLVRMNADPMATDE